MANSRIEIAKKDIINLLDSKKEKVYDIGGINNILIENREFWRLAKGMTLRQFIDFLIKKTKLKKADFNFPNRPITRYIWDEVPLYELILSLRPNGYITHYTAMFLHEMTDQVPKTIYINDEQKPKPKPPGGLTQEKIDFAFSCPTRISNNYTEYEQRKIFLLNGMHTGQLGVIERELPDGQNVRMTDIERTLIDITVRPEYAGGPFEVLRAYKNAKDKNVSINRLVSILQKIGYVYPYHQAIGFYLDKCGVYNSSQINLLQKLEIKHDFYLMHRIKEPAYSSTWRLFYPKGMA